MTPVRTAHGADPALGEEALIAIGIGLRACEPGSASAFNDMGGWRENMLSPAGARRTDLSHGRTGSKAPRLSIIVPSSRMVVFDIMTGPDENLEHLLPGRTEETMRPNAIAALDFVKGEIGELLRMGDDDECHAIARMAARGCAPALFAAMGEPSRWPKQLCVRHDTPWASGRVTLSYGGPAIPDMFDLLRRTAGPGLPPPVSSIQFEGAENEMRVTIGSAVQFLSPEDVDPIRAMRCLNEAHAAMKDRT